jgi:hypothetical protein
MPKASRESAANVVDMVAEQIHRGGVELRPAMRARDRHGGRRVLSPAEDFDRAGQLHQPGRQADLVTPQVVRMTLAVPLLVGMPDGGADCVVEGRFAWRTATPGWSVWPGTRPPASSPPRGTPRAAWRAHPASV